mgnify:FL=1
MIHDSKKTPDVLPPKCGALLLAGGKSRRMGADKAGLLWNGQPFVALIARQLAVFEERLFSVGAARVPLPPAWRSVADVYPDCGPMGGLHAGLSACRSPYLAAVSCDLPLLESSLPLHLFSLACGDWDAVVPVTPDGRMHPLCAVYRKDLVPLLEARLQAGNYRLMDALASCRLRRVPVDGAFARMLTNVNTPEDYQAMLAKNPGYA